MGKKYNVSQTSKPPRNKDEAFPVELPEIELRDFQDEKKSSEKAKEDKADRVSFLGLFKFADSLDYVLMAVGTVGAIIMGSLIQVNNLLLATVIDTFLVIEDSGGMATATTPINTTEISMTVVPPPHDFSEEITQLIWQFCVLGVLCILSGYCHMTCWCITSERQTRIIRKTALTAVLRQHMGWFDRHQSGEINTRLTSDVINIQNGIGDKMATFIQWTSTFVAGMVICVIRGWQLTLVMLAISPLAIIAGAIVARMMQSYATKELNTYAHAGAIAEEVLGSIRTVAAFSGEEKEAGRYDEQLKDAKKVGIKRGYVAGSGQGILWFTIFSIIAFAFWYGAKLVREQDYSVGIILQVQFSLFAGTRAMGQAMSNLEAFSLARGAASAVYKIIASVSEIDSFSEEGLEPSKVQGTIRFEKVSFFYPTLPDAKVLSKFDLTMTPGKTIALVGQSGCGKSTAVQLIQRFYDPTIGKVMLDGTDIRELNVKWLRRQVGVVSQEPVLFATTIAENIRFGREGVTQAEIEEAAKAANAHNFIMDFPSKYDTSVGSKGGQMSGGQKQRIAIARALVRNPKILLLDDATSALDYQSESIVQDALDKARMGRTTLIISHRLSTIRSADEICVLHDGEIVERGSHEDLLHKDGIYAKLVSTQLSKDDESESETDSSSGEEFTDDLYNAIDEDYEGRVQNGVITPSPGKDSIISEKDQSRMERTKSRSSSRIKKRSVKKKKVPTATLR